MQIGQVVSHYEIVQKIGEGGMGVVYKGHDLVLGRDVALKFPSPHVAADRFLQEARAASALDHVNICTIFEVGETSERAPFIAMALYQGETLTQRIERGPIPSSEAVDIALQVARGLQNAHSRGIVHRDIKPSNVVVTAEGIAKILDFGLARAVRDGRFPVPDSGGITIPGTVLGTVGYLSPEQARGESADARSDLWSLGVVLYEMLARRTPFAAGTAYAVMDAILRLDPHPLREYRRDVPEALVRVVMRALQKAREQRYQRAADMMADLQAIGPRAASDTATAAAVLPVAQTRVPTEASTLAQTTTWHKGAADHRPSVAVLPFANLSSDVENEYFSDGLTDELINALSQLRGLRVVCRTSVFEFKNKAQSVRKIGMELGVPNVLEGSVRRSGDRLRVTAQLVHVNDACQLWAGRFDRKMTDVFDIQDEIAQTIARTLEVTLTGLEGKALVKRYTDDLEAYQLYLKGRFHWNARTAEGFTRAREYFEAALARDPAYAPAYSGLADYYMSVAAWGLAPPTQAWPDAKTAALKALEVDPSLAEAHASLGVYRTYGEWDWAEGEREFLRARKLNPGDVNARVLYATYLIQRGRFADAQAEMERALDMDPLSATVNTYVAGVAHYARRYDDSIELCRKALELAPNDVELFCVLALNYEQKRMFETAIDTFETARRMSGESPLVLGSLGATYARAGRTEKARELAGQLQTMSHERYVPPIAHAWIHIALGEADQAFDWLERAADAHDSLLCYLGVGPIYDVLRAHPRFRGLMRTIGLQDLDRTPPLAES